MGLGIYYKGKLSSIELAVSSWAYGVDTKRIFSEACLNLH